MNIKNIYLMKDMMVCKFHQKCVENTELSKGFKETEKDMVGPIWTIFSVGKHYLLVTVLR